MAIKILGFLWNRITAALSTLLLLGVLIALILGYRLFTGGQSDNEARLEGKQEYLAQISQQQVTPSTAPNIVFILYDDMGYGDIGAGAKGSAMIATPHINQLAADGVVLTDFHWPRPTPTCSCPRKKLRSRTLLRAAGYATGMVGKWHMGDRSPSRPGGCFLRHRPDASSRRNTAERMAV